MADDQQTSQPTDLHRESDSYKFSSSNEGSRQVKIQFVTREAQAGNGNENQSFDLCSFLLTVANNGPYGKILNRIID